MAAAITLDAQTPLVRTLVNVRIRTLVNVRMALLEMVQLAATLTSAHLVITAAKSMRNVRIQ